MADGHVRDIPGFSRLWLGTGISALGTFVGSLSLAFTAVKTLDASPAAMAALATVQLVAAAAAAPVAGVVVDRLRRRPLLIAADLVRAAALLVVPVAAWSGWLSMVVLGCVGVVTSAGNVLFNAAYGAHLPRLVGREYLVRANATIAATVSVAEIAGFAAAGWLVQLLGAPNAQFVDAASFVASALCIVSIGVPEPARTPRGVGLRRGPSRDEVTAGFRFAAHEPVVRALLGTTYLYDASTAMIGVSYLLYLSGEVGFGDGLLGSIFAIGGVASLLGARWADRAERTSRVGRALAVAGAVRTVGVAAMPAAATTGGVGVGLLVANQVITDPAWMLQEVTETSVRQARTPDEFAGRVGSVNQLVGTVGRLSGTGAAWLVGTASGPRASLWLGCGLCGLASLILWASPVSRVRTAAVAYADAVTPPPIAPEPAR